jgi:hypothetical protein
MDVNNKITKNFKEISETLLWDENLPISFEEYEALLSAEDTDSLFELLVQEDVIALRDVSLEDLVKMPFTRAQICISKFSLAKRIKVLEDLDKRRSYLYNQAARYGDGNPKEPNKLSAKDWRTIMGRIKHLEILAAWLYGIN